jgi:hypothetical protein
MPGRTFKVGDELHFQLGRRRLRARIVEDRGFIGPKGERVMRLRALDDDGGPIYFEMTIDALLAPGFLLDESGHSKMRSNR